MSNNKPQQIDKRNLYHFTDASSAQKIIQSGKIKAQPPHGGKSNMPTGAYFTQMTPCNKTAKIVENNYDDRARVSKNLDKLEGKTQVAFVFPKSQLDGVRQNEKTHRNEWISPKDVSLDSCKKVVRK